MFIGIAVALAIMCGLFTGVSIYLFFVSEPYELYYDEFAKCTAIVVVFGGAVGYLLQTYNII